MSRPIGMVIWTLEPSPAFVPVTVATICTPSPHPTHNPRPARRRPPPRPERRDHPAPIIGRGSHGALQAGWPEQRPFGAKGPTECVRLQAPSDEAAAASPVFVTSFVRFWSGVTSYPAEVC